MRMRLNIHTTSGILQRQAGKFFTDLGVSVSRITITTVQSERKWIIRQISDRRMTNASLRERLGIGKKNYPQASRVISDTLDAGLIKLHDGDDQSKRNRSYLPYWA